MRFIFVAAGGWWLMRPPGHGTALLGLLMGLSAIVFGLSAVALGGPLLPPWMKIWGKSKEPAAST
jgi:hypothetical protein